MGIFHPCAVDVEKWQKLNRVKLYFGQVNRWVIARTIYDAPTEPEVRNGTFNVMGKWFKTMPDAIDGLRIVTVSFDRPPPQPGEQRREDLPQPPLIKNTTKGLVYATVDFNYRGLQTSMPWPVWENPIFPDTAWTKLQHECPYDAMLMLESALAPVKPAPAIEETNALGIRKSDVNLLRIGMWIAGGLLGMRAFELIRGKPIGQVLRDRG